MKRTITILSLLFATYYANAQVGINTTDPQETLHIAGSTGTIRIESLNRANAPSYHETTGISARNISISEEGNLILAPIMLPLAGGDFSDPIPSAVSLTSATGASASGTINFYTFTLDRKSIVSFNSSVGASFVDTAGATLVDARPRLAFSWFQFTAVPAGSGIAVNTMITSSSAIYTPTATTGTTVVNGNAMLNNTTQVILPAGTYTVALRVSIYGGSYGFRVLFGGTSDDRLSIVAIPI